MTAWMIECRVGKMGCGFVVVNATGMRPPASEPVQAVIAAWQNLSGSVISVVLSVSALLIRE